MNSPGVNTFDSLALASAVWQTSFNDSDSSPTHQFNALQCNARQADLGRPGYGHELQATR